MSDKNASTSDKKSLPDFEKVRQQCRDFRANSKDRQTRLANLKQQAKRVSNQLDYVKKQRGRLDKQESDLQAKAGQIGNQQDSVTKEIQSEKASWQKLQEQLRQAKRVRNIQFLRWLFKTYPEFDRYSLKELESWVIKAMQLAKNQGSSNGNNKKSSNSSTSGHKSNKVQDVNKIRQSRRQSHGNSTNDDNVRSRYLKVHEPDKVQQQVTVTESTDKQETESQLSGISYQDRQRIFTNEDDNNPIDTNSEASDAEELESPYGQREADDDADSYLAKQAKKRREAEKKATKTYSNYMDGLDKEEEEDEPEF